MSLIFFDEEILWHGTRNKKMRTGVFMYASRLLEHLPTSHKSVFKVLKWISEQGPVSCFHTSVEVYRRVFQACMKLSVDRGCTIVYHRPWYGRWGEFARHHAGIKKVLTIYDCIVWDHPEWFDQSILSQTLKWERCIEGADFFVFISESTRVDFLRRFKKIGAERTAVTLLGPSVPKVALSRLLTRGHLHDRFGLPPDRPYLLSVCTLEPRKNLLRLIEAFTDFKLRTGSDVGLVLVGAAGWGEETIRTIQDFGKIRSDLTLAGYVDDDLLPSLYHHSVAFVYPTLYEGFGLPVLDAMRMGIPVISSKLSSIPEVTGNSAILIDPYCVNELSSAIERILSDHKLRADLSKRGAQKASEFTWERCAEDTLKAYRASLHN